MPALLNEGHSVVLMEAIAPEAASKLKEVGVLGRVGYRWKSLLDIVPADIAGFAWVINLAALTDVPLAISSPKWTWHQNTDGVLALLEAIRTGRAAEGPGLIYISSESVYGKVPPAWEDRMPITEEFPLNPVNVYGASKAAAEILVRTYTQQFNMNAMVLRSTSMFGERGRLKQVIPIFIRQALAGEDITIEGDGSQTRDFSYVGNQVNGILLAMKHGRAGLWNIGCGSEFSIRRIAETIIAATGSNSKIVQVPWRAGEKGVKLPMSIDKARRELGYKPWYSLEAGLKVTSDWFKAQGA